MIKVMTKTFSLKREKYTRDIELTFKIIPKHFALGVVFNRFFWEWTADKFRETNITIHFWRYMFHFSFSKYFTNP